MYRLIECKAEVSRTAPPPHPSPREPGVCKRKERGQRRKEIYLIEMTAVLMAVALVTVSKISQR